MDLPLLASTFATVFLAELGDKTQLAIVTISGTSSRSGAVFAGSSLALVLASLLGAAAGGSLSSVIGPDVLQLAASVGFLVIGSRLLIKASRPEAEGGGETPGSDDSPT
ncbi:TMEM165/GDT1 family protein [Vulcanococcus sp.]|jgi:putative Ca2+/H+ antiporter (TMEM165/GDT1 family)|uniref:TMEM165/GDT1 family protein n=1 Tax=Vulcanococcus sp. TaxID=2856995 RepID=UPI0037D9B61E